MAEWNDRTAAQTLRAALDALEKEWKGLDSATRQAVERLIRQYGLQIAKAGSLGALAEIKPLLDALWNLGPGLPRSVTEALRAGQATAAAPRLRGYPGVPDFDGLLSSLRKIVDFRVFEQPEALSAQITARVSEHLDRLTLDERTAWQQLEAAYQQNRNAEAADAYLRGVEKLLGLYPQVRQLLEQGKGYERKPAISLRDAPMFHRTEPSPSVPKSITAAAAPAPATTVQRYGNVYFPSQVLRTQQWVPLVIHIAQYVQDKGAVVSQEMRLTVGDLTLFLRPDDFTVESAVVGGRSLPGLPIANARIVTVEPDRDSEPVVFFLTPQSAGCKRISVDVFQLNRQIATLAFETEVVEQGAFTKPDRATFEPMSLNCLPAGAEVGLSDLELRVTLLGDGKTLSYDIRAPARDGLTFRSAGRKELRVEPLNILQPIFDRLSVLARKYGDERTDASTQDALREIRDIGTNLYEELFSDELKQAYLGLRGSKPGEKSLLIMSDEPWIPWEMVRASGFDPNGQPFVDPPLCETFQLSRWLAGPGAPEQVVTENGVLVAPPDNLEAAKAERSYFLDKVNRFHWGSDLSGLLTTVQQVEQAFEAGKTRLYHFSCHGNINTDDPDESKLKLEGGYLRPSQITGLARLGLDKARPLVFLNACHAGRIGFGLTRLGGWAERFLDAGVSVFIGSQWEIRDELAAQFAQEFYDRLWGLGKFEGQLMPLGRAFYDARQVIKAADPANPTWLAYVLYGDPNGHVLLKAGLLCSMPDLP
jgi:hypothetical protein